ncbi:MAG: PAS domain S-box protein [Deltaproteobacteria bacterium]|nr:PAS domain S-box protein [Deltaproteobacteria bacterium]
MAASALGPQTAAGGLRLLLLEDNPHDAELVVATLEDAGYKVTWDRVQTRGEFLRRLPAPDYDLILADYAMPGFDGLTALYLAQEQGIEIPFVLVSGTLGEEVAIESLKAGATDYVLKTRLERLVPVVRRALQEREVERKQHELEAALRASEQRFRSLIENASDLVSIVDAGGIVRYLSPSHERVLGYAPEEFVGTDVFELVHPDDLGPVLAHFQSALTGADNAVPLAVRFRHRDGSWRVLEGTARNLLHDPAVAGVVVNTRDITERTQAEAALRASEQRYATLTTISPVGVFHTDEQGRCEFVNERWRELAGLTAEQSLGEGWIKVIHPDDRERVIKEWYDAVRECRPYRGECRMVHPDGTIVWVLGLGIADKSPEGKMLGYAGTVTDITEIKQAQLAAQAANDSLHLVMAQMPAVLWTTDAEPRLTSCTGRGLAQMGLRTNQLVGSTLAEYLMSADPELAPLAAQRRALGGESVNYDFELQGRTFACHIEPLYDNAGAIIGTIGLALDVTEQKRAEARLRESEEQYRELVESLSEIVFALDEQGRVAYISPVVQEVGGYQPAEVIGRLFVEFVFPDDVPELLAGFQKVLGGELEPGEYRLVSKSGEVRWVRSASRPIIRDGRALGVRGTLVDISERKRAEDEISRLNAELEQRVQQRTAQLEAANKELEAFSYSVSHDLRGPLRAIDGFSKVVLDGHAGQLDEEGQRCLQRVRGATQHMGELIDDLLRLGQVTRSEMHWQRVDLSALAEAIAAELQKTQLQRRVTWSIAPALSARGDVRLLRVALENLLGNAWKYTGKQPAARIEFGTLPVADSRLKSPAASHPDEVVFFVRDDGAGFDMSYAAKLFGAFQRLHRTGEFEGTGIGLATVQRIIQRHGGRVWAEAEVGRGATFYFTLGLVTLPCGTS